MIAIKSGPRTRAKIDAMKPPRACEAIHEEHAALLIVLDGLVQAVDAVRTGSRAGDFFRARALLLYLDEVPQREHHLRESQLLFPKLRAKAPWIRRVLDRLDREHHDSLALVRQLEHSLTAYEALGDARRDALGRAIERYSRFYRRHIEIEEQEILPLALRVLSADDWEELREAFEVSGDPATGCAPQRAHRALLERVGALA